MYLLQFFNHDRYIKIDGRPVFIIYRIGHGMMCYPSIQTSSSLNHLSIHQSIYSSISLLSITIAYQLCYPYHYLITSNHPHSSHYLSTSTLIITIYLPLHSLLTLSLSTSILIIITVYFHNHHCHYLSTSTLIIIIIIITIYLSIRSSRRSTTAHAAAVEQPR